MGFNKNRINLLQNKNQIRKVKLNRKFNKKFSKRLNKKHNRKLSRKRNP